MEQYIRKKKIFFDQKARKEFLKLPNIIRQSFERLIKTLEFAGSLRMPDGRKLQGMLLFEIRVKVDVIWRCIYAYIDPDEIIPLSFFNKKSMKTQSKEIKKALNRLRNNS